MTSNKESNMVYIVMGGWNYAGEDAESVQIFRTEADARAYGESLVSVGGYNYFEIVVREVPAMVTR